MRVALISRYPRVDTPHWKRRVAEDLSAAGCEIAVLYSRASIVDQARAGLAEEGLGVFKRYAALRRGGDREPVDAPESLAAWADSRGLPVIRARRLGDDEATEGLRGFAPDVAILVGADIVPRTVLSIPRIGTINPHYGLLPAYRGMNVTEWSVLSGDPVGVTVHMVDPGIDTGDILLREEIPLDRDESFESLRQKHQTVAARLLVEAALSLRDGSERRTPQRPEEGRQYYRMHSALRALAERRLREQTAGS
jgi:methionyl-tRNA formyltransferase